MGNQKYKQKHKRLGLCRECSEKATHGRSCEKHRIKNVVRCRKKMERYRKEGRCYCSRPLLPEDIEAKRTHCIICCDEEFKEERKWSW